MPAPAAELQKAIFAALGGDAALIAALGGAHIYDRPRSVFPSISFGRTGVYDWSSGAEKDAEQLFTLHIWSKAKGDAKKKATDREKAEAVFKDSEEGKKEADKPKPLPEEAFTYGYHGEMRHFVECARDERMPRETYEDGYIVNLILDAGYASMRSKKWVRVRY